MSRFYYVGILLSLTFTPSFQQSEIISSSTINTITSQIENINASVIVFYTNINESDAFKNNQLSPVYETLKIPMILYMFTNSSEYLTAPSKNKTINHNKMLKHYPKRIFHNLRFVENLQFEIGHRVLQVFIHMDDNDGENKTIWFKEFLSKWIIMIDQYIFIQFNKDPLLILSFNHDPGPLIQETELIMNQNFSSIIEGFIIFVTIPKKVYKLCAFCGNLGSSHWILKTESFIPTPNRGKRTNFYGAKLLIFNRDQKKDIISNDYLSSISYPGEWRVLKHHIIYLHAFKYAVEKYNLTFNGCRNNVTVKLDPICDVDHIDGLFFLTPELLTSFHFLIGYFYFPGNHFQISGFYLTEEDVFDNYWSGIIGPLGLNVFLATIGSLLVVTVSIKLFLYSEIKLMDSFFISFRPLMDQCLERLPSTSFKLRIILCFWLFYCLIVSETYRGELVSYLTRPKNQLRINNLAEFLRRDYEVVEMSTGFNYSVNCTTSTGALLKKESEKLGLSGAKGSNKDALKVIGDKLCGKNSTIPTLEVVLEFLKPKSQQRKIVVISNDERIGLIREILRGHKGSRSYRKTKNIIKSPVVWYLSKRTFERVLGSLFARLYDSGILNWANQRTSNIFPRSVGKRLVERSKNITALQRGTKKNLRNQKQTVLRIKHLKASCLILIFGLIGGMVVFCIENNMIWIYPNNLPSSGVYKLGK